MRQRSRSCLGALCAALIAACGSEPGPAPSGGSASDEADAAADVRLPDGRPDFNGTWAHAGGGVLGLEYVQPEELGDGSVCLFGCGGAADDEEDGAEGDEAGGGETEEAEAGPPFPPAERTLPSYRPELEQRVRELDERQVELDTVLRCFPPGVPRIGPPRKIVQTGKELVFLYDDYNGPFFRIVPLDRPHRSDVPPSYLGDAVATFEGDTLVVDTVSFTEHTWLTDDGAFHSKDLRVVERLRRVGDTIEYEAVAHDPAVLTEPWLARAQTLWLDDRELEEPVPCQERDLAQMRDASHHENPR